MTLVLATLGEFAKDTTSVAPSVSDTRTVTSNSVDDNTLLLPSLTSLSSALPQQLADVQEDRTDPDLLVLGFQELDLSAGALLYATEASREDAWCAAVFAGLGEKAVLYEKVCSYV